MRCPKCSESFQVHRDGSTAKTGGGAAPSANRRAARKRTQVGVGPQMPPPVSAGAKEAAPSDLPAPEGEVDLPAPFAGDLFGDLPAPKEGGQSLDFDPFGESDGADLPTPKEPATDSGFDPFADMDLPAPLSAPGGTDLPAPLVRSGESEVDLPAPKAGGASGAQEEVDLPMALTDAELPRPMDESTIPEAMSLDSDLPIPTGHENLPVAREDFADLDIDGPERVHGGGPVELDLPDGGDLELDMEVDESPRKPPPPPPVGQIAGPPGQAPAEGRDSAELVLPSEEELEFSELEESAEGVHRMPHPGGEPGEGAVAKPTPAAKKKASLKAPPWLLKGVATLAAFGLILGVGFYLGTTKYGLFGIHLVEPFMPGAGDDLVVAQAIESAEMVASADTYATSQAALDGLRAARQEAGLNRALAARGLLHESFHSIRFGQDAESASVADELRLFLQRRGDDAPRVHVALAADALRNADIALAKSEVALAATEDGTDVYVDLVSGEVALKARDAEAALQAFDRALAKHESARSQWGIARAHEMLGDRENAASSARATYALNPEHAGAAVAVAEALLDEGKIDEAYELLQAPAGLAADDAGTPRARADESAARTLVARIEEQRGRLGAAREMYEKAIELDTSNVDAALGAARLVLLEGAYPDAYARFKTVLGSEVPPGAEMHVTGKPRVVVEAKLGAVEALVAMDKGDEAQTLLADLQTPEPVSRDVELWRGKVFESLKDTRQAVRHFRDAIQLDPKSIQGYMALAQHYTSTKRPGEAVAVLVEAQRNVEITAEVRRLLGWAELQRGRVDEAIDEFQKALRLDENDSSARFGLAIAYRRNGMLEKAAARLAEVEAVDAKFPGLALERGRLAEAAGDMDGAVLSYRKALEESPNDAALKSRLGAALMLIGQLEESEQLLKEVISAQPYSAEAEHFLGRINMERGQLESARQHFLRAARLDSERGMYRMYVAWVALETNEMTTALRELDNALKLDPGLGDAYWLRARIGIRAGTVRDALTDLRKALDLNPNRIEAWAAMGECHYQLGQVGEAISDYEKAVAGDPSRGVWWYRLGRLQLDEGRTPAALASLSKAASIGDQAPEGKAWLADAHRLTGDILLAQNKRQDAVVEYGRYLQLAPRDAIDRPDVEATLRRIGDGRLD